jgi:hypothetical protein
MSRSARQLDFLHLHTNAVRRVRNLETGVHPLPADVDYTDSIPLTLFPKDPLAGSAALTITGSGAPDADARPHYQKRSGIASLTGYVTVNPLHADIIDTDGALYGTLPEALWPARTHATLCFADAAPWVARVLVTSTGQLRFYPGGLTATTPVYLDGFAWPTA